MPEPPTSRLLGAAALGAAYGLCAAALSSWAKDCTDYECLGTGIIALGIAGVGSPLISWLGLRWLVRVPRAFGTSVAAQLAVWALMSTVGIVTASPVGLVAAGVASFVAAVLVVHPGVPTGLRIGVVTAVVAVGATGPLVLAPRQALEQRERALAAAGLPLYLPDVSGHHLTYAGSFDSADASGAHRVVSLAFSPDGASGSGQVRTDRTVRVYLRPASGRTHVTCADPGLVPPVGGRGCVEEGPGRSLRALSATVKVQVVVLREGVVLDATSPVPGGPSADELTRSLQQAPRRSAHEVAQAVSHTG